MFRFGAVPARFTLSAKSRVHANLTMIGSREINPLKAAWDAEVALQHLLAPQRADMLGPLQAMTDACDVTHRWSSKIPFRHSIRG